jgi:hypothetical protein
LHHHKTAATSSIALHLPLSLSICFQSWFLPIFFLRNPTNSENQLNDTYTILLPMFVVWCIFTSNKSPPLLLFSSQNNASEYVSFNKVVGWGEKNWEVRAKDENNFLCNDQWRKGKEKDFFWKKRKKMKKKGPFYLPS